LNDEVGALRAEVAALRAELAEQRDRSITRRRLLTGLAGLGAAGVAGVGTTQPAAADDGEPLLLGVDNTSESTTAVEWGDPTDYPEGPTYDKAVLYLGGGSEAALAARSSEIAVNAAGGTTGVDAVGSSYGIRATTDGLIAVKGDGMHHAIGVLGSSEEGGAGVYAMSGLGPAILLKPTASSGPPLVSFDGPGALSVDANGDLWLCVAEADFTPTWTRLLREDTAVGRTIPITPIRALDTRATGGRPSGSPAVPGQKNGPLKGGETITLDLAGVAPIPTTASGIFGNLTAVTPSYTGYVRVAPSGQPFTATALSFTRDDVTGNAFTAKLGPDGVSFRGSGTTSNTYELVVDITAYIT
jgi:hypothetical protein